MSTSEILSREGIAENASHCYYTSTNTIAPEQMQLIIAVHSLQPSRPKIVVYNGFFKIHALVYYG